MINPHSAHQSTLVFGVSGLGFMALLAPGAEHCSASTHPSTQGRAWRWMLFVLDATAEFCSSPWHFCTTLEEKQFVWGTEGVCLVKLAAGLNSVSSP